MSFTRQVLTIIKRIFIVIGIAVAFTLGLMGAIYLSLRSSETRVPNIVGKDRVSAENTISDAGLNFRVRATRATSEAKPDTVLIQLPHAGEIVKVGQTVAVDISGASKNSESSVPDSANTNANANTSSDRKTENSNTNSADNTNDKPKKKPTPKTANANANANGNGNANRSQNRNANANQPPAGNTNDRGTTLPGNSNSTNGNANRAPRNVNSNRRPPAPAPTP